MGFNVTNLTDYTQEGNEIFRESVLFSDSYSNYNIQMGISYKEYINSLNTDVQFVGESCGTEVSGSTTINEKVLEVANFNTKQKYCYADLEKKALGSISNFESSLTQDYIDTLKFKLDILFWEGDLADGDLIDGLKTQALADANAVTVTNGSAITVANIITAINKLISGMPQKMMSKYGKLTIHTSTALYDMYRQALTLGNYFNLDDKELKMNEMWVFGYQGKIKIIGEPGFTNSTDSRMILISDDNIFVGTDELQSVASLKIVYDEITDYVWFKTNFKLGVTYLFSDEVIILKD